MRTRSGPNPLIDTCTSSSSLVAYKSSDNSVDFMRDTPVSLSFDPSYHFWWLESFKEHSSNLNAGTSTKAQWNDFEHHKVHINSLPVPPSGCLCISCQYLAGDIDYEKFTFKSPLYGWYDEPFGSADSPFYGAPVLYEVQPDGHFVTLPANISVYIGNSLRAMLPKIRPNLSLINSTIELKDLKGVPAIVNSCLTNKWLLRASRSAKTLRVILKSVSNGWLQTNFNLLPLLSDISGIQNALRDARVQVKKLLEQEKQLLVHHYNAPLTGYAIKDDISDLLGPYDFKVTNLCGQSPLNGKTIGRIRMHRNITYPFARFHAQIQYSYFFSEFQRQNALLLGLQDVLGVNLNPAVIWNALPWSFVVDWVIGVSQWLDQFKIANLKPITVIHKYLYSTNVQRRALVDITTNINTSGRSEPSKYLASDVTEESYRRVSGVPSELTQAITASGFSLKEFSLASALTFSRRRR